MEISSTSNTECRKYAGDFQSNQLKPFLRSTIYYLHVHMQSEPKPLPFTGSLTGISDKTSVIHHDKLYAGYVAKKNEISEKLENSRTAATYRAQISPILNSARSKTARRLRSTESIFTNGTSTRLAGMERCLVR